MEENGPAHDKQFTVELQLGNEFYTAKNRTIKAAQHAAAAEALEKTKYSKPVPRSERNSYSRHRGDKYGKWSN